MVSNTTVRKALKSKSADMIQLVSCSHAPDVVMSSRQVRQASSVVTL